MSQGVGETCSLPKTAWPPTSYAYAVGLGIGQRGYAKRAHENLAAYTGEQGVVLAAEVPELENLALVENCFVHKI